MTHWHRARALTLLVILSVLTLVACGASGESGGAATPSSTTSEAGGQRAGTGTLSSLKVAALFSGSVTDGDFSQLGLHALHAVENDGADVSYTESVPAPDAEQTIRDYVADGYDVIWTHGSQFFAATVKVAADNPGVHFIAETEEQPPDPPANVWTLDWQFHLGFYAMGVLAATLSHTGKIGYVGGLSLPFSNAEVHAMQQAIADLGSDAALAPVWTGDFNDPAKARRITTQLIDDGADVIVGSLNNGAIGTFQAVAEAAGDAWVTAKYTDKTGLDAGGHYAGAVLYDFAPSVKAVLAAILAGEDSGYYPVTFSTGITISMPDSVPADIRNIVSDTMNGVEDGSVEVIRDTSKVGG